MLLSGKMYASSIVICSIISDNPNFACISEDKTRDFATQVYIDHSCKMNKNKLTFCYILNNMLPIC